MEMKITFCECKTFIEQRRSTERCFEDGSLWQPYPNSYEASLEHSHGDNSSAENQKDVNADQWYPIENQKGVIAIIIVYSDSALLVINRTLLNSDNALLALNWRIIIVSKRNKVTWSAGIVLIVLILLLSLRAISRMIKHLINTAGI